MYLTLAATLEQFSGNHARHPCSSMCLVLMFTCQVASCLRDAHRGQVLFSSSDPSDTLILVISGQVKVVVR